MDIINPYKERGETMDVTTKTLNPVELEHGSVRLPDLVPDNKSQMNAS